MTPQLVSVEHSQGRLEELFILFKPAPAVKTLLLLEPLMQSHGHCSGREWCR